MLGWIWVKRCWCQYKCDWWECAGCGDRKHVGRQWLGSCDSLKCMRAT